MKNNIAILLFLLCAWLCMGSSCKDKKPVSPTPKNYFTCKINGVEYKPSGYDGTPNYYVDVDPNYKDGVIAVVTYSYKGNNLEYSVGLGSDSLKGVGKYYLTRTGRHRMLLNNYLSGCEYYSNNQSVKILSGYFTFDQYDLNTYTFSGEFEVTMTRDDGCDTLRITEGKFYYHQ